MKKQTLVMIWSSVILLIVVACVGIYIRENIKEDIRKNGIEIIACATADINSYEVLDRGEGYILQNSNDGWQLEGNSIAVLDDAQMSSLISAASRIKATGKLSKKQFKEFEPKEETEVTITLKNGEKTTLTFVGEKGGLSAFKVEGDNDIYTMYSSTKNILTPSIHSLRHFELFENVAKAGEFPDYYEYVNHDGEKVVVRIKTNYEISKSDANRYIMTNPYSRSVDDEKFEQQILVKVQTLKADRFITDRPESVEPYGLDEDSRAILILGRENNRETVYFGRHEGDMVYAKKENSDSVVLISAEKLDFLSVEPFFLLEGGILKSEVDKIRAISIFCNDKRYEMSRQKNGNSFSYFINGNVTSEEIYNEIAEKLGDVSIMNEIHEAPAETREIVLAVSYDSNQSTQIISLSTISDKKYATFVNGKAEFAIDKIAVDELMERLAEIVANPMKLK